MFRGELHDAPGLKGDVRGVQDALDFSTPQLSFPDRLIQPIQLDGGAWMIGGFILFFDGQLHPDALIALHCQIQ